MSDTKWLQKRRQGWLCVQEVPKDLVAVIGKRRLIRSLHTRDKHVAIARRFEALAEFQAVFDAARRGATGSAVKRDSLTTAALTWRRTFARLDAGDYSEISIYSDDPEDNSPKAKRFLAVDLLQEEGDEITAKHGAVVAAEFVGIARGDLTPLLMHVPDWLAEGGKKGRLEPKTQKLYRANVDALAGWLKGQGITTVEGVTKRVAGAYVTQELVGKQVKHTTANRSVAAFASYWSWLGRRAGIEINPWHGARVATPSKRHGKQDGDKRPFTDDEVSALFSRPAPKLLSDVMHVAALSGMRLSEVLEAKVEGDWFHVSEGKTDSSVRAVPVHSALRQLVARRCPDGGLLFPAGTIANTVSTMFMRHRRRCGIGTAEGQSDVDLHSMRRWFISTARNAGVDRAVVAAVVGHEAGNITDDTYGSVSDELKRACVETVRLPTLSLPAPPTAA